MKWLTMLLGSVRAENLMKSLGFARDGNKIKAKLVKKSEAPKRGQFNIMLDYGNENVLPSEREISKGAAVCCFPLFISTADTVTMIIGFPIIIYLIISLAMDYDRAITRANGLKDKSDKDKT